jgi:hypothetical protein
MKKHVALLVAGLLGVSSLSVAANKENSAPKTEAEIIAAARANYPLKKCLVSDEDLGSMGDAVAHVHREAGKPDRVVFVCCEGCIDDFKKEPAKFLKKVDDAAKTKGGAKKKKDA